MKAQFHQPVTGTLMVVLDDGTKWEAKDEDLAKFKLITQNEATWRIRRELSVALGGKHAGNTALAPVWDLIVKAIAEPEGIDTSTDDHRKMMLAIEQAERLIAAGKAHFDEPLKGNA